MSSLPLKAMFDRPGDQACRPAFSAWARRGVMVN